MSRIKLAATPDDQTRAACAHLAPVELRLAERHLGTKPENVDGPPVGCIIGESPGPNTAGRRVLFPWPIGTAGERLMSYARLTPGQYLGRFFRRNLFREHIPDDAWSTLAARTAADRERAWIESLGGTLKVVLLGTRVGAAFGFDGSWQTEHYLVRDELGERTVSITCIPHPSGLNRVYNEERARNLAGEAVRWAAEL